MKAPLVGLVRLKKRLQSTDPEAFRLRVRPVFAEALKKAYDTYSVILKNESVSEWQTDTIASGRLLRAFNRDINTSLRVSAARLYFNISIRSTPKTQYNSDPAEYYDQLDDAGKRSEYEAEKLTTTRVLTWMRQRGLISSFSDMVVRGKRRMSAKSVAETIRRRIIRKTAARGFGDLRLTDRMYDQIGMTSSNSELLTKIRGLVLV